MPLVSAGVDPHLDDARRIVGRMALPARDWLEVLLHAAKLSHRPISDFADWGATDRADDTNETHVAPREPTDPT